MAYQFQAGESVRGGVKRILSEEIQSALQWLSQRDESKTEETIHEVRKSIKKIRAVLRLVREPLGEAYAAENVRWRNIGRRLSAVRDADAIFGTFEQLRKKYKLQVRRDHVGDVRRMLLDRKTAAATHTESALNSALRAIRPAQKRVDNFMLEPDGFDLIAPGLESAYKRGRKALGAVRKKPSDIRYHELRKRVKDVWYHSRLLQPVWPEPMENYENTLDDLQEALGEDHNLVVLRDLIKSCDSQAVGAAIAKEQQKLRDDSVEIAKRVYKQRAGEYLNDITRYWRTWNAGAARGRPRKRP